jgi:hypothetical protein
VVDMGDNAEIPDVVHYVLPFRVDSYHDWPQE